IRDASLEYYSYAGKLQATLPLEGYSAGILDYDGNSVLTLQEFHDAEANVLRAVDLSTMLELWQLDLGEGIVRDSLFAEGGQSFLAVDERLVCLDAAGQQKWEHSLSDNFTLALSRSGSLLLFG